MNSLISRAIAAYFRYPDSEVTQPAQPSMNMCSVVEHEGRKYVILSNSYDVLAVYRCKTDGFLKRLVRWPKAVLEK